MPHESNNKCLDDSIVVYTSSARWPGCSMIVVIVAITRY